MGKILLIKRMIMMIFNKVQRSTEVAQVEEK